MSKQYNQKTPTPFGLLTTLQFLVSQTEGLERVRRKVNRKSCRLSRSTPDPELKPSARPWILKTQLTSRLFTIVLNISLSFVSDRTGRAKTNVYNKWYKQKVWLFMLTLFLFHFVVDFDRTAGRRPVHYFGNFIKRPSHSLQLKHNVGGLLWRTPCGQTKWNHVKQYDAI